MADPAKEERAEASAPSSSNQPPPQPPQEQQQQAQDEPQEPVLDTFWRWPLLILFLSYVFALYVRDATSTDTADSKKEAAGVVSSHQHQPPHTNGQAPVVIPPERTPTASFQDKDGSPSSSSSSLSFPIAGGGGDFHQHPHILVQYCTS